MRIRFALAAAVAATALQTFAAQQPAPQLPPERPVGKGIIEVQVTRAGMVEGIPEVAVTLQGPTGGATAEQVGQLFTPSSSLTAAQRQQLDQLIQSGFEAGVPAETIVNAAQRQQAQLLGQPAPATLPGTATRPPADLTLMTDTDGRVSFPSLPAGRYTIRAQRDGYYGTLGPGATEPSTIVNGTVTIKDSDDAPARLALAMMRGVVLGGRLRDPEGRPLTGLVVSAQQAVYQNGRTVLNTVNQSQSDDRGIFRMFWLPPGDYYVSATPRSRSAAASSPQDAWAKTYFPGVVDARVAAPITAAEGAELNGIDFAIQAEAIGRISGRIINPFKGADGKPTTPGSQIILIPQNLTGFTDTGVLRFQNVASEQSNGEFEIRSILPGVYDLLVNAPTGASNRSSAIEILNGGTVITSNVASATDTAFGRIRVDVGKEALTNVTVAIKAGLEVKVRVTMDGAPPPYTMSGAQRGGIDAAVVNALIARGVPTADAIAASRAAAGVGAPAQVPTPRVRLSLQPKDNAPVAAAASQASFDPSGLYVFASVPQGNYRLQAQLPAAEAYVADIRLGGASIYDEGLVIDGPLPGDIEVAIVSKGSRLQGTVQNVENRPAANASVALIPAETRRQNVALYKTTRTNATGTFTLNGVAPGAYKLFAWEDVPNNAWQNADFLSRYDQLGETVSVMGGESVNSNLKLIPKNYGR